MTEYPLNADQVRRLVELGRQQAAERLERWAVFCGRENQRGAQLQLAADLVRRQTDPPT